MSISDRAANPRCACLTDRRERMKVGGINCDRLRALQPIRVTEKKETGLLGIEAIALTYWQIHRQHPSAWTQEIDLRPSIEPF